MTQTTANSLNAEPSVPQRSLVSVDTLRTTAREIRGQLVEMSHRSGAAHLGSALSCVDILVATYWTALAIDPLAPDDPQRDRFILSKGHAASALYATLAYRGFFSPDLLVTYGSPGSNLPEHPSLRCLPGVEAATGSLGHGLAIGLGMALAGRLQGLAYRCFVLLSDGECNEGSVWESAMLAPAQGLERLVAVIDYNKWQATGRSDEVTALRPLRAKWEACGWSCREVDGHDMTSLVEALRGLPDESGRPVAVVAHTTKGKGVSFMEDDNNWHYRVPSKEEVGKAKLELGC
jgi:transketolase